MATQRTCVIRPYGQQQDYVPVEHAEYLVIGETVVTGEFEPRSQTIPGPFSGGVASSQRTILVPVCTGALTRSCVDADFATKHDLPTRTTPGYVVQYQFCR